MSQANVRLLFPIKMLQIFSVVKPTSHAGKKLSFDMHDLYWFIAEFISSKVLFSIMKCVYMIHY